MENANRILQFYHINPLLIGMVWYGLHTSGAWMIGHNISIEESRWSFVRLIYSERQGVHSYSFNKRFRRDPGTTEGVLRGFAIQRTL